MKSLFNYFLESKEDGKYLDLPQKMYKPMLGSWLSKEQKQAKKDAYKLYKDSVLKINTENFEILIDKLKKAMESKKGHNNFILNAQTCKFDSFYGKDENGNKDFFNSVEIAAKKTRIALESDDFDASKILITRQPEKKNSWDKDKTMFWWDSKGFTFSIYSALSVIAQAYNIDVPKFDEDFNIYKIISTQERLDDWVQNTPHSREISDEKYHKQRKKFADEYKKDAEKLKKVREKFKKSNLYKDIIAILDIVEDDLQAVESNYKKWSQEIEEQIKKDKEAKEFAEAIENVKETVKTALEKSFGSHASISWGVDNLYKLAAKAYLESDKKQPDIKELSNHTGGWLSGMHTTCEFEVIGANGTSYGKVKLQDKGLDGDDGKPVDGFGAWD